MLSPEFEGYMVQGLYSISAEVLCCYSVSSMHLSVYSYIHQLQIVLTLIVYILPGTTNTILEARYPWTQKLGYFDLDYLGSVRAANPCVDNGSLYLKASFLPIFM